MAREPLADVKLAWLKQEAAASRARAARLARWCSEPAQLMCENDEVAGLSSIHSKNKLKLNYRIGVE